MVFYFVVGLGGLSVDFYFLRGREGKKGSGVGFACV